MAVVQVAGGDGSSGGQSAQHGSGGEMHFESWIMAMNRVLSFRVVQRGGWCGIGVVVMWLMSDWLGDLA